MFFRAIEDVNRRRLLRWRSGLAVATAALFALTAGAGTLGLSKLLLAVVSTVSVFVLFGLIYTFV